MNICTICQGDGILQTAGRWYCVDHVDEGFRATARVVLNLREMAKPHDDREHITTKLAALDEWLEEETP